MKTMKKLLSLACALALTASLLPASAAAAAPTVGGWFESIYAELPGVSDNQVTAVSWSGAAEGALTGEDLEYLVRNGNGGVRIDIPGLKAGEYTLKITAGGADTTVSGIQVLEHDRSGYAHYNYTDGVGAYNDDGTLKKNAKVIYVTDETKDTVKLTVGGSTYTGLGNILGRKSGVLNKLAKAGTPLVVRLIGEVKAPKGVTEKKMSTDAEKQNGDNGSMLPMTGAKDLTIEGVGSDATINGWGLSFTCQTSDYAQGVGKSFEVRNLTFRNVPEDCVNLEGVQDDKTLTAPVERCWVHNCSFYVPKIANPAAVDKAEGDGAVDFKRGQYVTLSYNYFEGYHKTHLIGGADNNLQYHVTWHHNHYYKCESRGPLGRQANMHIYNCIYENQSSYCMNTRANCYIFSEYNSFLSCKNPMRVEKKNSGNGAGGPIKSFNDKFTGCSGDRQGTVVKDKTQRVPSGNRYASFELDAKVSYIPSGNYKLDESNAKAEEMVRAYAGAMKAASAIVHPNASSTPTVDTTPSTTTPAPAEPSTSPAEVTMPADVRESDWFYPAVKTVLGKGAMKGTNLGFEPHTELTIASIYQTLYNMEGAPAAAAGETVTYTFDPADIALGTSADRAEIPDGTAYAGGYMTTSGKVVQRWHESRGAAFCAELDKDQKGAIEFTVASTAEAVVSASSTGGSNTSAVGLLNVSTGAMVPNAEGVSSVTGTAPADLTYQLGAGTYRVVSTITDDPNMNRGVRIHGVTVTAVAASAPASNAWYASAAAWAHQQGLYTGNVQDFADHTALRGDVKTIMDAYCAQKGVTAVLFKGDQNGNLMLDKTLTRAEWAQVLANLDRGK